MFAVVRRRLLSTKIKIASSPAELAATSQLLVGDSPLPNRDISPLHKMPKPDYENPDFTVPQWKKTFGETFVSLFHIDMDNVRAGTIGGSKYYYLCKDQALQYTDEELTPNAKFWYDTLGMPKTFAAWYQVTILHVWMLFVRMRAMPHKEGRNYQQKLTDKLFKDIELRLSEEMNVLSGQIRETYMKDFHSQMMGMIFSLDEAFARQSDDVLASALWRNIFNGDKNVDIVKLEALIRYVRMQLYVLDTISDREFGFGDFEFVAADETVELLTLEERQQLTQLAMEKYNAMVLPSQKSALTLEE